MAWKRGTRQRERRAALRREPYACARHGIQRLRERSGLRWIAQRDVDIVCGERARRTAFRGLQLRANGDFGFVAVDLLRSADNFAGDRSQLGFREVLLAAAGEKQQNKSGTCR